MSARDWARFGEFIRLGGRWEGRQLVPAVYLNECFFASAIKGDFGLGWWLGADEEGLPPDLVWTAGLGKQRLYVSAQSGLTVVRQTESAVETKAWDDAEFIRRLLGKR
jgi:CubicO group peptidase (beta-lactamase class C family)